VRRRSLRTPAWRPWALVALVVSLSAVTSACGQGSGTFAQSHAPTGAPTVFVAIGDYEFTGPSVSDQEHQDWTQLFYGQALSRRSTLYDLSSSAGPYVSDLLSGEVAQALALRPDLVAVWVGLPDLLDGMPPATFGQDLELALTKLDAGHARVLVANLLPIYGFPAYRSCEAQPLACDLPSSSLPSGSQLATAVSGYDFAISRAAGDGRASVVDLTGTFTRRLGAGGAAGGAALVDQSDLGLTAAGEQVVAGAFEAAYSASRR
jgi:hypothetical protein